MKRAAVVNVTGLLEKYQALFAENHTLREENEILKARLGMTDPPQSGMHQALDNNSGNTDSGGPIWRMSFTGSLRAHRILVMSKS